MPSETLTLGFDTSAAHCAAALLQGDSLVAARCEEMKRGQSERLMGLLEELLATHGATWRDLDRIGVGIGPGNFTGIRIAVSAARGLGLSLGVPAVGVSTFDATRFGQAENSVALVPAPREQVYVLQDGKIEQAEMADWMGKGLLPPKGETLAENIARIAARAPRGDAPPAPLYVRPADAAPASDPPPVILDDA